MPPRVIGRISDRKRFAGLNAQPFQGKLEKVRMRLAALDVRAAADALAVTHDFRETVILIELILFAGAGKSERESCLPEAQGSLRHARERPRVGKVVPAVSLPVGFEKLVSSRFRGARQKAVQHVRTVHPGAALQAAARDLVTEIPERPLPALDRLAHGIDQRALDIENEGIGRVLNGARIAGKADMRLAPSTRVSRGCS
jgi:hypothetical protein